MPIRSGQGRQVAQHSAEHYKRHRKQLAEKGTVKKEHAGSTKGNIHGMLMKWKRHCTLIGEDKLNHLVHSTKEDIMTFLKWILDFFPRVQKRSTLHEYWRTWCMLYRKSVGHSLHAKVMEEVNDYIKGYLTKKYNLETVTRQKPVMNVDDIFLILHHHWVLDTSIFPNERQRLQLALLLLLSAYTATRPGALVYKATSKRKQREHYIGWEADGDNFDNDGNKMDLDWEEIKTLCYEDVTLLLLPNPDGKRDVLVMEVVLKYTKGCQNAPKPKWFILTEVDALIFDPIILMIALAILDNAFDSEIKSVGQLFQIRVPAVRYSLEFQWKKEKLKTPVFRQAELSATGIQTSDVKALRYYTYLYYLQRLGLAAGFMQILCAYNIRRGTGEAVEGVGTQGQLQQVMAHKDAITYHNYINERVQLDVQAAFLGRPSCGALFKAVTHMSRYVDPRAPTELTPKQTNALKADPEIVQLQQLRDRLTYEAREESGTVTNAQAEGTKIYQMYKKAGDALQCAKVKLRKSTKKESRQQFFDTIDTVEINKQLDLSLLDLNEGDWEPKKVEHCLEERRHVADLISKDLSDLDDQVKYDHRIRTVDMLVALCQKREAPRRRKADRAWGIQREEEVSKPPPFPTACARTQCLFCFGNSGEPFEVRLHNFATVYKARNHVELHLKHYKLNDNIPCPDPGCQKAAIVLYGHSHFMSHAAREHRYDIFRKPS